MALLSLPSALWLMLAFFLSRFAIDKPALGFLGAAVLVVLFRALMYNRRPFPTIFWLPTLALVFGSMAHLIIARNPLFTYATFTFICVLFHAMGYSIFSPSKPRYFLVIAVVFILTVLPFALFPTLTQYGVQPTDEAAQVGEQLRKFDSNIEARGDIRAYFFHSAELGQFAAAVLIALAQSIKFSIKANPIKRKIRSIVIEVAAYAGLIAIVVISDSYTSKVIVIYTLCSRFSSSIILRFAPLAILTVQLTTQLFFASDIASVLQSGSFWWRYNMAEIVTSKSAILSFSPELLNSNANWMHSIFLDFALSFGVIAAILLYFNQALLGLARSYRTMAFGWSCLFLAIVAVQPIGASAVYITLALSLAYAEGIEVAIVNLAPRPRLRRPNAYSLAELQES